MSVLPAQVCWPLHRLGEALEVLARAAGLPVRATGVPAPPADLVQPGGLALTRWMEGAASWLGLEAEFVEARHKDVDDLVLHAGPAILRLFGPEPRFLVLVGARRGRVRLRTTEDESIEVALEAVRSAFCEIVETPLLPAVELALESADVPPRKRDRARRAILREQLGGTVIRGCFLLRRSPDTGLRGLLAQARWGRKLAVLLLARAVEYAVFLLSWWVVGSSVLGGHLELSWLIAWAFLLLSTLPFRVLSGWLAGLVGVELGNVIKQRLLSGSLLLEPGEIRHEGAGQLLGRVIEADALEALTVGGGLIGVVAVVELIMAAFVLGSGPNGLAQLLGLLAWAGLTAIVAAIYLQQRRRWTRARLEMTHALIEKIVGHRTRVAQEDPERWYEADDLALERYLASSRRLDRVHALLAAVVPRGWLFVGVATLGPAFVAATAEPSALAVALGGILLGFRAFRTLVTGLADLLGAAVAWEQAAPLQRASARAEVTTTAALATVSRRLAAPSEILLDAQAISFRHAGRHAPALRDCSLKVHAGERLLLEGASGSGKSTFGAILAGLRVPSQGLLLIRGLDRSTLGLAGWRRHVASAPQFHENHILSAPFAFNLLLGRQWPPRIVDLEEAEDLCRELGLGGLLDRMPGGMMQMVGETGWQLSHGEKSRIYVARTILQGADLIILDESFAALDPETLRLALDCVMARAQTLLLIAHP
ncbi:ABC transporter ATP-binding protein [Sorangium sp. So ce296]|uniref:ATP-binding cassette domain-containing protein n=1 Tax=Sorangium sp. So ce296 TaxID=3133296 RepID=UPI003F5DFF15